MDLKKKKKKEKKETAYLDAGCRRAYVYLWLGKKRFRIVGLNGDRILMIIQIFQSRKWVFSGTNLKHPTTELFTIFKIVYEKFWYIVNMDLKLQMHPL